jgi:SSS family solute:Na+ symporter
MVAGRRIPGWAAGLSVMCAYTSSLSYIATPGKSFGSNWNPVLFAYAMIPVALFVTYYIISYYRSIGLISVYEFLEKRLGSWGRVYAAISFMLYMIARIAAILYLTALLFGQFAHILGNPTHNIILLILVIGVITVIYAILYLTALLFGQFAHILGNPTHNIILLILVIGVITVIYTLLGGMEAVIWADVMQAVIMLSGIAICCGILTYKIVQGPEPAIVSAWEAGKFSLGEWKFSLADQGLANRTILVMIIFGVTENLRNLMADQNYVQKFAACSTEREAKKSIWVATIIYVIMTTTFIYIGTALYAHYHYNIPGTLEGAGIKLQDDVFPFYIATGLFAGFRGLLIAAILAAAISTIATAFNCSATIWLQDFHRRYINKDVTDKQSIFILRLLTVIWGILGMVCAGLMIYARSVLDVWWQLSGIFGGGILGLFLLALFRARLRLWQGIVAIAASIVTICWGTFLRQGLTEKVLSLATDTVGWLSAVLGWLGALLGKIECNIDPIIVGATGTAVMVVVALLLSMTNRGKALPQQAGQEQENA